MELASKLGRVGIIRKTLGFLYRHGPWGTIAAVAAMILFAGTLPAQAYLDPGTGSIILQAAIGAIAGALVAARLYWGRIKSFLKRGKNGDSRDNCFKDRK